MLCGDADSVLPDSRRQEPKGIKRVTRAGKGMPKTAKTSRIARCFNAGDGHVASPMNMENKRPWTRIDFTGVM